MQRWLSRCVVASSVTWWCLPAWAADSNGETGHRDGAAAGSAATGAGTGAGSTGTGTGTSTGGVVGGGGAESGPLPPLPSSEPVYYDSPPMPAPLAPRRSFKWGAQFRLEGAPMGSGAASNAGMGGFGISFRPRPSPGFAVDIGADFFGGRDFNGERRGEQSLTIDPMIFVNPRGRVSFYLFAGLGLSSARVEHADGSLSRYGYIGVNGGPGLEFRFWRRIAIDADVMFFVRDHTDNEVSRHPEFVEPVTGRYTNTSKGAIIRLGLAYYW